jgi:hypothetical protein
VNIRKFYECIRIQDSMFLELHILMHADVVRFMVKLIFREMQRAGIAAIFGVFASGGPSEAHACRLCRLKARSRLI